MVLTLSILFLVAALICFVLDVIGVPAKINLQSLGLAFLTAFFLF
jgi:hypothetical protein